MHFLSKSKFLILHFCHLLHLFIIKSHFVLCSSTIFELDNMKMLLFQNNTHWINTYLMLTYYFEVKKQFPTTYKSIKETHSEYNWVTNQICTFLSKKKWGNWGGFRPWKQSWKKKIVKLFYNEVAFEIA